MTNLWMGDGGAVVDFNVASGFMNKRKKETKKSQKKSNPKQKFQRPQSKTPFFFTIKKERLDIIHSRLLLLLAKPS